VLRAQIGQEFDIAVGARVRRGRVAAVSPDRVEFELGEEVASAGTASVVVALALFKFDRFEWAVEKLTEVGVAEIRPVVAARSDAHLVHAAPKRAERWRRVALAAAEQSRRLSPPTIADPVKLRDVGGGEHGSCIVLAERFLDQQGEVSLKEALAPLASRDERSVVLAVGPEGGWTDDELRWFAQHRWTAASLGPTILRAETAAIAAVAIAMSELER
jgi:16S rRNA (uracil1498-N3)-methyltransferase